MHGLKIVSDVFSQDILVNPNVVHHLIKNRQRHTWCLEAGGQLFGEIASEIITVKCASGPYPKDDRGPRHYRSHLKSAQRELNQQCRMGNHYIGEWHTHAERKPKISRDDLDAMRRIVDHSKLSVNGLLLLIVGQEFSLEGISAYSYIDHKLVQWGVVGVWV
jgi:integrative and conjugative element protein (TIGR02256 family)